MIWRDAINAFYDAGCRYLQLDDTLWAYLCSEEQKQQIRERGEEPQGFFVDLQQSCLSPQCGFASTEEGNHLTEQQQWATLPLVVDIANSVWS